ncbi:MAG: hypothetical protein ACKVZH_06750 [Blastocatellia bacterium]
MSNHRPNPDTGFTASEAAAIRKQANKLFAMGAELIEMVATDSLERTMAMCLKHGFRKKRPNKHGKPFPAAKVIT